MTSWDVTWSKNSPKKKKSELDAEGPLGPIARSIRLQALLTTVPYKRTVTASSISWNDYSTWRSYFIEEMEYKARIGIPLYHASDVLGLKGTTMSNAELYFGKFVILSLRRRHVFDATVIGIADDETISPVCIARTLRYGVYYERPPKLIKDMEKVIAARRLPLLQRLRFRRRDPLGLFV